jgi:hypothetical protein
MRAPGTLIVALSFLTLGFRNTLRITGPFGVLGCLDFRMTFLTTALFWALGCFDEWSGFGASCYDAHLVIGRFLGLIRPPSAVMHLARADDEWHPTASHIISLLL